MICLDPRVKLYLLLEANLLLFFHVNTVTEVIIVVLFLLPFFLSGKTKSALRFTIIYMILLIIGMMTDSAGTNTLLNFVAMAAVGIRMILPCLIAGAYAFSTTTPSELFCALRKCHIPEGIIITCAVVIRFFPTVMEDYRQIRDEKHLYRYVSSLTIFRICHYSFIDEWQYGSKRSFGSCFDKRNWAIRKTYKHGTDKNANLRLDLYDYKYDTANYV